MRCHAPDPKFPESAAKYSARFLGIHHTSDTRGRALAWVVFDQQSAAVCVHLDQIVFDVAHPETPKGRRDPSAPFSPLPEGYR